MTQPVRREVWRPPKLGSGDAGLGGSLMLLGAGSYRRMYEREGGGWISTARVLGAPT